MISITNEELKIITEIFNAHLTDCIVYAFGSRCNGTAKKFSDLDLAFLQQSGEPLPLIKRSELEWAFSESDLPYLVDVVDFYSCTEAFKKLISTNWIKIFPSIDI